MVNVTADTILYTRCMQGISAAGVTNAGLSAIMKITIGLSANIMGFAVAMAGFDTSLTVQPAAFTNIVGAIYALVPAGMSGLMLLLILLFYHLEEEFDRLQGVNAETISNASSS